MKKNLLLLIILFLLQFTNAQVKEKGTFEITPKIGYSRFSEFNRDDSTKYNSGVEFGVTADYYFNNRWSLRSGFVFDKMGAKHSVTAEFYDPNNIMASNYTASYEDKLYYLSVPINANWHFGSARKWNLNFGLSPSFPINGTKSFQLGLTYGIGYKIEITKKFGILLDYQGFAGLTNINNTSSSNINNVGDSFNIGGVIQL